MFRAVIRNGKLTFVSHSVKEAFEQFKADHEGAYITLKPEKHTRSNSQNAYYWVYLGVIERETGETATDLHEFFKRKFLPPRLVVLQGEEIQLPTSTTTLSKSDFTEYLDKICALTNVPLPDPEAAGYVPH
jgi:hypothetical protein